MIETELSTEGLTIKKDYQCLKRPFLNKQESHEILKKAAFFHTIQAI